MTTPTPSIIARHRVTRGETLWQIARQYYGLASQWRLVYAANQETIGADPRLITPGMELQIPALAAAPVELPTGTGQQYVKLDIANLEGRKLLQQPLIMLNGVGEEAAAALQETLKIKSIFDLALARIFNAARELVEASGVVAAEYTKYNFVPGDIIRGDPTRIPGLDALLRADIEELNFNNQDDAANQATAERLKAALSVTSVRDLALWPPFQAARAILNGTFNPYHIQEEDPEAPAALLPQTGNFATERVYYTSIVMTKVSAEGAGEDLGDAGPIDLMSGSLDEGGAAAPAEGVLVTTEQAWYAQGVTLGQLLHSLALAPGESTRIALVDWTRRTSSRTDSATSQIEQLSQITDQARSISEITRALAQESMHGSSSSFSAGSSSQGGASASFFGLVGGSTSASSNRSIATSVSRSSGTRHIAANTAQNIRARTHQFATSSRSRRATIVQETFEQEKELATTRVITNYNHMHALSIQYYEVVQVYRVKTQPVHFDRVLFIPMKPFNFNDPRTIVRYREVLKAATPDEKRRNQIGDWQPSVSYSTLKPTHHALRSQADLAGWPWKALNDAAQDIETLGDWVWDTAHGGRLERIEYSCAEGGELLGVRIKARYGSQHVEKLVSKDEAREGDFEFTYLTLDSISEIELLYPPEQEKQGLVTLVYHLRFKSPDYPGAVLRQYVNPPKAGGDPASDTRVIQPVATINTRAPSANDDLIDYLNQHALHYSQAIWLNTDSLTLSRVLSGFSYGPDRQQILTSIDLNPVAMTGNYLGFRWHFTSEEARQAWIGENELDALQSDDRFEAMVPLPTGGVFAEAVQGRFNAAEKLDLTRFWNWQDSPIPIVAPEINPITMVTPQAGAGAPATDRLDAPAVQITTAPGLPDPTGVAAILQNIAAANLFRDMSGLASTAALAQSAGESAERGAAHAGEQATKSLELGMQHQREMAKLALEALPLLAGPAGLGASSVSKAGAVMNMAHKLDAAEGGEGASAGENGAAGGGGFMGAALSSLLGRLRGKR